MESATYKGKSRREWNDDVSISNKGLFSEARPLSKSILVKNGKSKLNLGGRKKVSSKTILGSSNPKDQQLSLLRFKSQLENAFETMKRNKEGPPLNYNQKVAQLESLRKTHAEAVGAIQRYAHNARSLLRSQSGGLNSSHSFTSQLSLLIQQLAKYCSQLEVEIKSQENQISQRRTHERESVENSEQKQFRSSERDPIQPFNQRREREREREREPTLAGSAQTLKDFLKTKAEQMGLNRYDSPRNLGTFSVEELNSKREDPFVNHLREDRLSSRFTPSSKTQSTASKPSYYVQNTRREPVKTAQIRTKTKREAVSPLKARESHRWHEREAIPRHLRYELGYPNEDEEDGIYANPYMQFEGSMREQDMEESIPRHLQEHERSLLRSREPVQRSHASVQTPSREDKNDYFEEVNSNEGREIKEMMRRIDGEGERSSPFYQLYRAKVMTDSDIYRASRRFLVENQEDVRADAGILVEDIIDLLLEDTVEGLSTIEDQKNAPAPGKPREGEGIRITNWEEDEREKFRREKQKEEELLRRERDKEEEKRREQEKQRRAKELKEMEHENIERELENLSKTIQMTEGLWKSNQSRKRPLLNAASLPSEGSNVEISNGEREAAVSFKNEKKKEEEESEEEEEEDPLDKEKQRKATLEKIERLQFTDT